MQRACDLCGQPYEAQRTTSRYCGSSCRARASMTGDAPPPSSDGVIPGPLAVVEPDPNVLDVESATRKALEEAGRVDSPAGQAALLLARRMDHGSRETGSSLATLAKQLAAQLEVATAGAHKQADEADEMRERRARRRAG